MILHIRVWESSSTPDFFCTKITGMTEKTGKTRKNKKTGNTRKTENASIAYPVFPVFSQYSHPSVVSSSPALSHCLLPDKNSSPQSEVGTAGGARNFVIFQTDLAFFKQFFHDRMDQSGIEQFLFVRAARIQDFIFDFRLARSWIFPDPVQNLIGQTFFPDDLPDCQVCGKPFDADPVE